MARALRIEHEGAFYHVLARGNKQRDIFRSDDDRAALLKGLGEISQLRGMLKDKDPTELVQEAARLLKCDTEKFKQAPGVTKEDRQDRDMVLYFIRETGLYTNRQIGNIFGLTYSAVSRRANIIKLKIGKSKELNNKYRQIKSLIKV